MNMEAPNDLGVSQRIAPVAVPAVMFRIVLHTHCDIHSGSIRLASCFRVSAIHALYCVLHVWRRCQARTLLSEAAASYIGTKTLL